MELVGDLYSTGEYFLSELIMSALITPTFGSMKQVVELLEEKNLRKGRFVIIGGGPTSMQVKEYVGADAWTLDPKEGINWCRDFVTGRSR